MIKQQDHISLFDYPLFTFIIMETPMKDSLNLPSDACVAYILEGEEQIFSKSDNIFAKKDHAIVSLCGLTLGKMLTEQSKGNIHSLVVHFNREILNQVFEGEKPAIWEELQKPVTQYVVQSAATEILKIYFSNLVTLFENKAALTETILKIKLKEIILLLLQTENSEYIRQIIKSLFSERQFSFKELVEANIENTDSIENLAMATNSSVATFKRKFSQYFKTTPAKYRLEMRLNQVAEKLKTTDESIANIGYECGFNSPEHLCRVFKNSFGVTPSAYRLS
jgi:AraC-like DNA-binding protein